MYCPKCKEIFEEGSRRFCPTDGARLVSETGPASRRHTGGIFSNLIPKINASRETDEAIPAVPHFVITEPEIDVEPVFEHEDLSGDYFEFEDIEPDAVFETVEKTSATADPGKVKPEVRKIRPYEIPAGHVDLEQVERPVDFSDFDAEDPEGFVGRTVKGRYCVTELIGGDGNSFSYLAYDKIFRQKTVLVRIVPDDGTYDMSASIMDDELVALSHVNHPNVARLVDSGQFTDKTRFLISEYVDALSVSDVLNIHGAVGASRAARIIRQVAYALDEVHQEGIVHRDLRPENIIIARAEDENEQPILVNFGVSNGEANERNLGYKCPEVFDGRLSTISGDVFSLAVIAFEMLTGVMPFDSNTPNAVVRSQYEGPQRLPSQIRRELRSSVDRVLEKALAFNVADRYAKARDFGDAFYNALAETPMAALPLQKKTAGVTKIVRSEVIVPAVDEPAWKMRSPEPSLVGNALSKATAAAGILGLILLISFGWFYFSKQTGGVDVQDQTRQNAVQTKVDNSAPRVITETEMPPVPRNISQPPNTNFYQNSKQNLKGDLFRNFVGFTLSYPKDWKVNGPQESSAANSRGKFLDISSSTPEGRMKEQMLVSYYPSKGTFNADADKFPQLVKETNQTLERLLPGYKVVSEGETKVNGEWRAYEVKFQGSGTTDSGEQMEVWGRRLFIPASRPGIRSGFEVTMLATSSAEAVRGVEDVGVRGELASIFYSFEPGQNF